MKMLGAVIVLLACCLVGNATPPCYSTGRTYSYYPAASYYYAAPLTYSLSYDRADQTERINYLTDVAIKTKDDLVASAQREAALYKALVASGAALPPELKALALPPHPGKKLEEQTCVRCHSQEDNAREGGRHVFYRAGIWIGTKEEIELAVKKVKDGDMPRGPRKFTGDDKFDWLDWVTRPATAAAAPAPPAPKVDPAPPKLEAPKVDPKVETPPKAKTSGGGLSDVVYRR